MTIMKRKSIGKRRRRQSDEIQIHDPVQGRVLGALLRHRIEDRMIMCLNPTKTPGELVRDRFFRLADQFPVIFPRKS